jgi:hypothetical protein
MLATDNTASQIHAKKSKPHVLRDIRQGGVKGVVGSSLEVSVHRSDEIDDVRCCPFAGE